MAEVNQALNELFAPHKSSVPPEVMLELNSILRLHSTSPQELFYKWESYSIKMGGDNVKMDLQTARDFKKDLHEVLERESRSKMHVRSEKKTHGATPRNSRAQGDMFGMMDGVVPNTPRAPMNGVNGNSIKRRNNFETPGSKASKLHAASSPGDINTLANGLGKPFVERTNAGQVVESLNGHIDIPEPSTTTLTEPRIKLKANTDLGKFAYKPMAMKLSEASEILDDRIDEFLSLVQVHHQLEDSAFGNPSAQSTSEIVAVGRIASDTAEGKLNAASVVLETSRRTGAGLRVALRLERVGHFDLFPGKIVAVRGSNASGEYFTVSEILDIPLLPPAASTVPDLEIINTRLCAGGDVSRPLNIIVSSGPYTTDAELDFEPLQALCDQVESTSADALILLGPFLDIEHPLIASGNLPDFPSTLNINPDTATLTDIFRALVASKLQRLAQALPSLTVILVPSVRDAINKHVSYPQDRQQRKELGLPKQCSVVTNPVTLSLNEFVVAISSQDVLYELRREECTGGTLPTESQNLLARLSRHVIEQRHFFPLFPATLRDNYPAPAPPFGVTSTTGAEGRAAEQPPKPTGAMLDISYLALAEWQHVRPDILITPSALAPFAKVVESVLVINPGTLSKRRGPGTFARLTVKAAEISEEEREEGDVVGHKIFERARVDVVRI